MYRNEPKLNYRLEKKNELQRESANIEFTHEKKLFFYLKKKQEYLRFLIKLLICYYNHG